MFVEKLNNKFLENQENKQQIIKEDEAFMKNVLNYSNAFNN